MELKKRKDHGDGFFEEIYDNGEIRWIKNGRFHCEGGKPAIERPDGTKFWYVNGNLHRLNGPAIIHSDGYRKWFKDGVLHREDGPAVEWIDGTKEWHIEGTEYTEKEFKIVIFSNQLKDELPEKEITQAPKRLKI
jgi:hypothetical protein